MSFGGGGYYICTPSSRMALLAESKESAFLVIVTALSRTCLRKERSRLHLDLYHCPNRQSNFARAKLRSTGAQRREPGGRGDPPRAVAAKHRALPPCHTRDTRGDWVERGRGGDREMRGDEDHKNNGEDEPKLLFGCEKVKKMIFSAYELITS